MGQRDAFVDAAAVHSVASRFDAAAELIDGALRVHFANLAFDGAMAGRAHVAQGDELRIALGRLNGELAQWKRASVEIASALRGSADRYAEADAGAAARIG